MIGSLTLLARPFAFGSDCCADTCEDNTFTCGVSGYVCEDSSSPSKLFCNQTSQTQQETDGGASSSSSATSGADLAGSTTSSGGYTNSTNSTAAVWNETRAHVCLNCDPAMKDFFYTIGKLTARSRSCLI